MGMWYPEIVNKLAIYNSTEQLTVCEILRRYKIEAANRTDGNLSNGICDDTIEERVFYENIILGLVYFCGFIMIAVCIRFGRRLAYAICLIGCGVCGCLMISLTDTYVVSILFMLHIILAGICVSVVVGNIIDLIPTQFR